MARRKTGPRAWVMEDHRNRDRPRKDHRWLVKYEDPANTFKRRTKGGFMSKDAADEWRTGFLAAVKSPGGWHDPSRGDVLFKDVAADWIESQTFSKANTERGQRRIITGEKSLLRTRFAEARIGDVKHSDVRAWVKAMEPGRQGAEHRP